eukprot:UN34864
MCRKLESYLCGIQEYDELKGVYNVRIPNTTVLDKIGVKIPRYNEKTVIGPHKTINSLASDEIEKGNYKISEYFKIQGSDLEEIDNKTKNSSNKPKRLLKSKSIDFNRRVSRTNGDGNCIPEAQPDFESRKKKTKDLVLIDSEINITDSENYSCSDSLIALQNEITLTMVHNESYKKSLKNNMKYDENDNTDLTAYNSKSSHTSNNSKPYQLAPIYE